MVFDHPVSSLNHRWRRKVAKRLVAEAKERQVIVFTHDIVFLMLLEDQAGRYATPYQLRHLERGTNGVVGVCGDGPPWAGMTFKKRKAVLNTLLETATNVHKTSGEVAYEPLAHQIYGKLRQAWERAVEEVLFNGAIKRFDRGVHTLALKKVAGDFSVEDYQAIEDAMDRCSTFFDGHDDAPEVNEAIPSPEELRADLDELIDWVQASKKRR